MALELTRRVEEEIVLRDMATKEELMRFVVTSIGQSQVKIAFTGDNIEVLRGELIGTPKPVKPAKEKITSLAAVMAANK